MPVLGPNVVIVAYPLPNGMQALMPRHVQPRSCTRLDGHAKVVYACRSTARRGCPKHEVVYRCRFCTGWHRATKLKPTADTAVSPVAWVVKRAA
jgi:hypothetical protein